MSAIPHHNGPDWTRMQRSALGIGVAAALLCAIGAVLDRQQFFRSYLIAFMAWSGIAVGSLALWMIHNLTGGHWGFVLRRFLEAATRTLPLLLLAFMPIAAGVYFLYPWADHASQEYPARAHYLNVPFFLARTGFYFASWMVLAFFLNRWSREQDRSADPRPALRMQALSGPGLVIYGLTMTFASIDWVMSLDPDWSSTIFGALVATGQMLPALGLAIALATWFAATPPLAEAANADIWNDLGNLLLAFVMLWAYMMFSQFLLIWSGNLPDEISYYVKRSEGGWQTVGAILVLFYFVLPFAMLLSRDLKREPRRLRIVALAVVVMNFVHQFWMIAPAFSPEEFSLHWMDLSAVAALGGFWFAYFLWQLQARPLLPVYHAIPEEAASHA